MKRIFAILPVLALTAGLGAQAATADDYGPRGPGAGWHHQAGYHGGPGQGRGLARLEAAIDQLELTDEQRTKVRAVLDGNRDAVRKTADEMRAAHQALRAEMDKDTFDEKAVKTLADKRGQLMAQMTVERARMASEVKAVLTPEQREQLRAEMRPEGGRGMGKGRFGGRCNPPSSSS